jgi:hypothetical protein
VKYLKYDLAGLNTGDVVIVKLSGDSVNVRLMDPSNFAAYNAGRRHSYFGGHVTQSPFRVTVPRAGSWVVVIDRGGYAVNTTAQVSVDRQHSRILPPATSAPESLADVGRNLAHVRGEESAPISHDVFISHASEDKAEVARPLCDLLVGRGLTVWLDEIQMRVGDHLRRGIDRAVVNSRYAAVILSPSFFAKQWTQYELDGLVAREMNGEQIILPIWHHLTKDALLAVSPSLADRIALSTANLTLEQIADELAFAVGEVRA